MNGLPVLYASGIKSCTAWGGDLIGMTNMPEAKLAREAEMAYATVAMVTDYDCWVEEHGDVTTSMVLEFLRRKLREREKTGRCCDPDHRFVASAIPIRSPHRIGTRNSNRARVSRS